MKTFRSFYSILILHVALTLVVMVLAQDDQSGFISIDCGIPQGSSYTDNRTGIHYVSDAGFIDSGVSREILSTYKSNTLDFQLTTLRSFPQNTRNCYTLRPEQGKGNRYLIRARFMYGNYDLKGQPPQFDLHLGSDHWFTVDFNVSLAVDYEIIHLASSDYIYVCLVNIGLGDPFISALELRLLDSNMYANDLRSLILVYRSNMGTSETVRYADDKYDRIWYPMDSTGTIINVQTSDTVSLEPTTKEKVPSKVMSTAITTTNLTNELYYSWIATSASEEFFMYIYFAEVQTLQRNQTRQFNIYLNRVYWDGPISPLDHTTSTHFSRFNNSSTYQLTMNRTQNSTLPPIFNAIELYTPKQLLQRQTEDQDAAALWSTKSRYGLKKNWQGDPCVPQASAWDGINCSYNNTMTPRIIYLNLSSSGLSGEIVAALANFTMIQSLDLSYNNLTGTIPKFLASLDFLKNLNLTGNNFTRPIPEELLAKSKNGLLSLSIEANSGQDTGSCPKGSCKTNKRNKVVIPAIATTGAFLLLLLTIVVVLWRSTRAQTKGRLEEAEHHPAPLLASPPDTIEPRKRHFTYSELQIITKNFSTVIGKGGFGEVFHGIIDDIQVAVKMLSESSAQGYKEFQAEVRHLMTVHHKNITSLVGYCDEGSNKGIIYEYMVNGNLGRHLSDGSQDVLSWKKRLEIGYDAAQGLEYIHHGCEQPIVHRDVKCSNILLNEKLQAKLADFGLARHFSEGTTHELTTIAGTLGYLDPEYNATGTLTEKSDVYSFGVVLLELITGRRAISEGINIIIWVNSKYEEGSVEHIIDPRLRGCFDINTAREVVEVAMTCVRLTSVERPTMNDVVTDLKSCLRNLPMGENQII